jgi:Fe-S cluster assembly protein SufB
MATVPKVDVGADYKEKYGFFVPEDFVFKAKRGLNPEIVKEISWMKKEPEWMLKFRLRSLEIFRKKPMPKWGADLSVIDFENIFYYLRASDKQSTSWEDLPPDIKATYDRLGVPEAERKFLAGVSAQYESEVVYHSLHEELSKKGVIFTDTDSALRDHPELFKEYFGTIIPPADNKFSALNSAVWSGGSFIYVPKGVRVDIPLQAYFRINAENMGQFERTLIICDEGSFVHYIEGCVLANASVRVEGGEKPMADVRSGDLVLTHKGRWRKVLETRKRMHRGDLLSIGFESETYRALRVTPGHPFLVGRRDAQGAVSQQWLEAHQLHEGDLLALPAINDAPQATPSGMVSEVSVGRGRHTAVLERVEVGVDVETCWMIGLFLAEGTVSPNTSYLIFDSHTDEQATRDRVMTYMRDRFGLEPWVYAYEGRKGVSLRYSSIRAARLFAGHLGRTLVDRVIPDWIFGRPAAERAAIVRGFYAGEGNWDASQDKYRINQTNQGMAQRCRELLLTLGIRSSLSQSMRPAPRRDIWQLVVCMEDNRRFEELVLQEVALPRKHESGRTVIEDGILWMPIRSIAAIWTETEVYNLKVEEDESYIADGVVSHNCTAPIYTTDSLHSAVVEIIVKKNARCRYTTIQNWSTNVFNLVTKRAMVYGDATMEWVDGNLGSQITMKYPSVYLMEPGAKGDVLSVAFAGKGQHQDAGGKMIHVAPNTTSTITSKSISKNGGRTSYRGHIKMYPGANNCKSFVKCDALLLDDESRSDTYPYNDVDAENVTLGHEATVSKVSDEQLFYLMSRGITRSEAETMIVNGFIEPFTKELPLEYAVELNRLIQLEMEGSVG